MIIIKTDIDGSFICNSIRLENQNFYLNFFYIFLVKNIHIHIHICFFNLSLGLNNLICLKRQNFIYIIFNVIILCLFINYFIVYPSVLFDYV